MTNSLLVPDHPLIHQHLATLRHKDTPPMLFRSMVREISQVLFYEATRHLKLRAKKVPTPVTMAPGKVLAEQIGLMPVLRAGLGMAEAILESLPTATVWHLGLYRDHETLQPVTYYNKLPTDHGLDVAFVLDPMLATGGSAAEAIRILKLAGVPKIQFIGLIGAPEGVQCLQTLHPEVPIILAALDEKLNEKGYIVPGLGDAGDRQFGTR